MRLFYLSFFSIIFFSVNAQSKNKQIKTLQYNVYRIQNERETSKNLLESQKKQLLKTIEDQNRRTKFIKDSVQKLNNKLNEEDPLTFLKERSEKLQDKLDQTNHEIQQILEKVPVKFSSGFGSDYGNNNLINLFNISRKQVTHCEANTFEIIGKQDFIIDLDSFSCVVLGITAVEDFHASSGTNYIGLFKFTKNELKLIGKPIEAQASFGFGSYGRVEKFIILGKHSIGVVLNGGYSGQGVEQEDRSIYMVNQSSIISVFSKEKSYREINVNTGKDKIKTNWNMKYVDNGKEFFDIEMTEVKNGKTIKSTKMKYNQVNMKYE
jgi:hypothetical protein